MAPVKLHHTIAGRESSPLRVTESPHNACKNSCRQPSQDMPMCPRCSNEVHRAAIQCQVDGKAGCCLFWAEYQFSHRRVFAVIGCQARQTNKAEGCDRNANHTHKTAAQRLNSWPKYVVATDQAQSKCFIET